MPWVQWKLTEKETDYLEKEMTEGKKNYNSGKI